MNNKHFFIKFFNSIILIFSIIISIPFISVADDISSEEPINVNSEIIQTSSTYDGTLSQQNLNSRSCIVLDRTSKQIIYGKNEYNKVKMASTTKIMTAIIVIEQANLNDTIEISKKAAGTGGSRLGLKTGDKITINDLLYGLMLCSGNDAAVALAEGLAGSVPDFANLMNIKTQKLGLSNTHFESPHGLDSDGHYTTAYELALLSDYALKNPIFLKIVGTKNYTISINGYTKTLSNTNELLGNLDGIYGIKTGFTNGANRCLVTACKRGDMDIICVVLGADTKKYRTQDSIKLIEYTFNNFEYINIENIINEQFETWKNENINSIDIQKSIPNNIELSFSKPEYSNIPVKKDHSPNIDISINIKANLSAPIYKDSTIGTITVSISDNPISLTSEIIVNSDIRKKDFIYYFLDFFKILPNVLAQSI